MCLCANSLQLCPTLCDLTGLACQAPLSMKFSGQEYWSGLPCPPPGDPPDPGIKPVSPAASTVQADSSPLSHQGSPSLYIFELKFTYLKFTILKSTVQWHLMHLCSPSLLSCPKTFSWPQKAMLYLKKQTLSIPLSPVPGNHNRPSVSLDLSILDVSYQWKHTIRAPCSWFPPLSLKLSRFIHLHSCLCPCFIPLSGWVLFTLRISLYG